MQRVLPRFFSWTGNLGVGRAFRQPDRRNVELFNFENRGCAHPLCADLICGKKNRFSGALPLLRFGANLI